MRMNFIEKRAELQKLISEFSKDEKYITKSIIFEPKPNLRRSEGLVEIGIGEGINYRGLQICSYDTICHSKHRYDFNYFVMSVGYSSESDHLIAKRLLIDTDGSLVSRKGIDTYTELVEITKVFLNKNERGASDEII